MKLNEKALQTVADRIKTAVDADKHSLSLAWLLLCGGKAAVLLDCRLKDSSESDVMLFELNGRLCFSHHNADPYEECYFEAMDFFEREYSGSSQDIVTGDRQDMNGLIKENLRELTSMYENEDKAVREVPIKEIRYVCSIFKLNRLFGILTDDIQDSFYLRFGAADRNDRLIRFHDLEYIPDDECEHGYMYIDDFILDGQE